MNKIHVLIYVTQILSKQPVSNWVKLKFWLIIYYLLFLPMRWIRCHFVFLIRHHTEHVTMCPMGFARCRDRNSVGQLHLRKKAILNQTSSNKRHHIIFYVHMVRDKKESNTRNIKALQGEWKLESNPWC